MVEKKCHLHSQYHIHSAAVGLYNDTMSLLLSGTVYEWSVFIGLLVDLVLFMSLCLIRSTSTID